MTGREVGTGDRELIAARRKVVVDAVRAAELQGLVVTSGVDVRYLTGFTGSNGALLLSVDGSGTFLTDGRYRDQAAEQVGLGLTQVITRDLVQSIAELIKGPWGVQTQVMSVDDHARLQAASSAELRPCGPMVEQARVHKDAGEISALRTACEISIHALAELYQGPLLGRTELEIAHDLQWRMLDLGAEAIAFESIVAAGENSAIPHHQPTGRELREGDLLKIDFGARVGGYHADCTRTVVLGTADDWQREIYSAVRQAQALGVAALQPGASLAQIDAEVRADLERSGWADCFTTGLGHGVGLQIHEEPFFAASSVARLTDRTVLTMEPGIYLPGRGGVRIEDTVLVGAPPEVLTNCSTELLEIA